MTESVPQPPNKPRHIANDGYGRALRASFLAHGLFIFLIVFKGLVYPNKPKPYVPTLRVDMVGLPDVLKKDLSNAPPTASSKEIADALKRAELDAKSIKPVHIPTPPKVKEPVERADKDEMVLKPKNASTESRTKKLQSALNRIKALSKINSEVSASAARSNVVKGNKVSKGTSLSGDAKEAAEANYFDLIRDKLQENWALPVWIARQNYSAQIQLFIDPYGRIRRSVFMKPSGNAQFDSAIKKALAESQPFPHPPDNIAASLQADGILVGFPL